MPHLAVVSTHPVQYHAPVYRSLQQNFGIKVTVLYGSDFSIAGYKDSEFNTTFSWDVNLLSGYESIFLSRVSEGAVSDYLAISARGVAKHLRQLHPDAVLLNGYYPKFNREAFWYAWRSGFPLLFRAETTDLAIHRSALKSQLRDIFLRWFYQRQSALLYIGQNSLSHYQRLLSDESPLYFSPYCIDTSPFQTEENDRSNLRDVTRRRLGISEEKIVLLFSGKLVPRKAPELLMQACKLLSPEWRSRIVLVFLGDGVLRETLEESSRSEPRIVTHVVGFRNQTELSPFFHAADLLVLPSISGETWGLVVNEALHHGVPCLVSDRVGCAPDLIEKGETGDIFVAGDPHGLARAIEQVRPLVGNAQIRHRCRELVKRYSVQRAAQGIAAAARSTMSAQ